MPQTKVIGGGQSGTPQVISPGVEAAVDPLYLASRIALRPLDYTGVGGVLGHYAVAQKSGATVSLGAAAQVARIRWAPTANSNNSYCVLLRIKVGYAVITAVTTAVQMDFDAIIARAFTVDYTTNITIANVAVPPRTNAMRSGQGTSAMSSSQMGTNGPGICTTAAISGQTATLDANPFAVCVLPSLQSVTATGTAVALQAGQAGPMTTLYEATAPGQHPVVLSMNEGVVLRTPSAGPTTGTVSLYWQVEWAEVFVF